jgi:hypothetical protein
VTLLLPAGVEPFHDVVADHLDMHMLVHRPGQLRTPCGELMIVMQPRFGAYLALGYGARWCPACFGQPESAWAHIVDAAFPEPPRPAVRDRQDRDVFPAVNRPHRGVWARLHFGGGA